MGTLQDYVSAAEAAEIMAVSEVRVRQLLQDGRFRGAEKWNGRWAIPLKEVRRIAREERPAGRPKAM